MTTNKLAWRYQWPEQCYSGTLATGGGLLFVGRNDGRLTALDSATGKQLWEFQTGAGMHAPVSTFEHKGKQYVLAFSAGSALIGSARGDSVWLFGLDGTLPPVAAGHAGVATDGGTAPPASTGGRGRAAVARVAAANVDRRPAALRAGVRGLPWRRRQGRPRRGAPLVAREGSRGRDADRDRGPQQHAAVPRLVHARADSRRERLRGRGAGASGHAVAARAAEAEQYARAVCLALIVVGAPLCGRSGAAGCAAGGARRLAPNAVRSIAQVRGNLYRAHNQGWTTVFYVTPAGIVLGDPISEPFSRWLRNELSQRFPGRPVRYVVYSHSHWDHAEGASVFADTAQLVAHENMLREMDGRIPQMPGDMLDRNQNGVWEANEIRPARCGTPDMDHLDRNGDGIVTLAEYWTDVRKPDLVYSQRMKLVLGGQTVELIHPGQNHAVDATVMYFPAERAVFATEFIVDAGTTGFRSWPAACGASPGFDGTPLAEWIGRSARSRRWTSTCSCPAIRASSSPRATWSSCGSSSRTW